MFQSIKWRIITIYFILVLISMGIVGSFIISRLETTQIDSLSSNMDTQVESIINASDYLHKNGWAKESFKIDNTFKNWGLSFGEVVIAIENQKTPTIVAVSNEGLDGVMGLNAFTYKNLRPDLITKAFQGEKAEGIVEDENTGNVDRHLATPVISDTGDVEGVFYMIGSLNSAFKVVKDAKRILSGATLIALGITTVLGFIIALSITRPIVDLTKVTKEMAKGNFDQKVEVTSNDEIGQLGSMFNYLTDELKDTIYKMDLEKSKLDTIFNYMAEGVIAVGRNGILIHANPIAKRILGIDGEAIGKPFNLSDINIKSLNYDNISTLSGTSALELEESFYNIKYAPYKSDQGHFTGLIVVLQDATKDHQLEKMRKEFVANVSHELKTPITTIKSYTETMLENDMDKRSMLNFLEVIYRENHRMERLVRDLLQLSNVDYGALKLNLVNVKTRELIENARNAMELMARDKSQKILIDVPKDIPPIKADPSFAEQVMINIVSNAVKYTGVTGVIEIVARYRFGRVVITVSDNGIGIPKKDLNRIFERFYRVEKGRSREMGGTGLGLSIAKEMMELMNGKISLKSEFKKGTTVTLEFLGGTNEEQA